MLGKLLKYEFKDTAKLFLPLNAAVLVLSLLWAGFLGIGLFDRSRMGLLGGFLLLIYILSIMALFLITAVSLALRFYKTMYANQGYLTHTLPVSSLSIINSKIIAALSWLLLALFVCLLSVLILISGASGFPGADDFHRFGTQLSYVFGIGVFPSVCLILALLISFCFDMTMMVFASLSIGQLFHQYRIPAAIGSGILLYILQQVSSAVLLVLIVTGTVDHLEHVSQLAMVETSDFYRHALLLATAAMLLFGVIYYAVCYTVTKKKLNLE